MKITITAVSVPALRQIQAFRKRYEQQYPEDDLTIEEYIKKSLKFLM